MKAKNRAVNGLKIFLGALIGALLTSLPLFYFEFRDGSIQTILCIGMGLASVAVGWLFGGRIKGFREIILILLAMGLVVLFYEGFIRMLYLYEKNIPTTMANLISEVFGGKQYLRSLYFIMVRQMPAILAVIFLSIFLVDPEEETGSAKSVQS